MNDAPRGLMRLAAPLAGAGIVAIALLVGAFGLHRVLGQVEGGLSALPWAIGVHMMQQTAAGLGWGCLLPGRLAWWRLARARWLREAVNSILPVANLGGSVVGARLLARDGGFAFATALASAAADITGEGLSQVLFVMCGLGLAASLPQAAISGRFVLAVMVPLVAVVALFIVGQAAGVLGWVERVAVRRLPGRLGAAVAGLQGQLRGIYAQPWRMAGDVAGNFVAWSVGAGEVWVFLRALGHATGWREAYAIESLGLVARSVAFAVPAGLGAQETGFVLACGLLGLPHGTGLALSLLKRVRELVVGIVGVLVWRGVEWRAVRVGDGGTL